MMRVRLCGSIVRGSVMSAGAGMSDADGSMVSTLRVSGMSRWIVFSVVVVWYVNVWCME